MTSPFYDIALASLYSTRLRHHLTLLDRYKTAEEVWRHLDEPGMKDAEQKAQRELEWIQQHGIRVWTLADEAYPYRLRQCPDCPPVLYSKGNVNPSDAHMVSIVGTRRATERGKELTRGLVRDLHEQIDQLTIVSGGAYGIDINAAYLRAVSERYADLSGILQCMRMDLINEVPLLPNAQLLIANLLIEYIGCSAFQNAVKKVSPEYVSCVIQINTDAREWVSDSPYLHAFDRLDTVHRQMNEAGLNTAMAQIGYTNALQQSFPLPNGKALLRLDYIKKNTGAASE